MPGPKTLIGREEWCSLPDLGLPAIKTRIDSGAKTSALHAFNIEQFERDGQNWMRFDVHPLPGSRLVVKGCVAKLLARREIRSSNGMSEVRHVVQTTLTLGNENWPIEVTLTNRDPMGYRMLLGRQAMEGRLLVDPDLMFTARDLTLVEVEHMYRLYKPKTTGLKIAVLGTEAKLYSHRRLIEAGTEMGHNMRFIKLEHCFINISATKPEIRYRGGELLNDFDAVIPRIRPARTQYGCAVMRQFQTAGVFCQNDSVAIERSRDKLRTMQILTQEGIPMPVTGFAHSSQDIKEMIKMIGGAPLIIKLLEGTQGKGVVIAETDSAAESVIGAFKSINVNILVQEFVKESAGRDLRLFVVGGKVVGAMERRAQTEGEFRANLHLGGKAEMVKPSLQERKIAIRAAKALKLEVAGVDILQSNTGPKVIEVNSSPGLQGIEGATQKNIAGLMIKAIEKKVWGN